MTASKIVAAAASSIGGEGLDVDEVFSTYLYDGTGSSRSITNNIDLSGEGGLVWIKDRNLAKWHKLYDTERGATKALFSNELDAENTNTTTLTSFNSNGFTLGAGNINNSNSVNESSGEYASWTFRKAPKFFDVVTYTGNGTAGRTISHNLDNLVGMLIIKCTSHSSDWSVQHRMLNPDKYLALNETTSAQTDTARFHNTAASSSSFTVGSGNAVNGSGRTYVAYLFAHHNSGNPGEFGPDVDQDIIKCGSFTDSNGGSVNLGFEPQWVLVKRTDTDSSNTSAGARSSRGNWMIADTMRYMTVSDQVDGLAANLSNAEIHDDFYIKPTATGFEHDSLSYDGTGDFIYVAIRRGPLAEPENATDVFYVDTVAASSSSSTGFDPDMWIRGSRDGTGGTNSQLNMARLIDGKYLATTQNSGEVATNSPFGDGPSNQFTNTVQGGSGVNWFWKRAPGYFDVVAYQGTGSAGFTFNHNLGVKPEMIWVKNRGAAEYWAVYHKDLNGGTNPSHYFLKLNGTDAETDYNEIWNDTEPTATQVTVGQQGVVNSSSFSHIAYLFATVAGISKVGSYTGNGSSSGPTVDCGFSGSPRFVLIKKATGGTGSWYVFDSVRGIVAGAESQLYLNSTAAEQTATDQIDPTSSGFQIVINSGGLNTSGETYIFYAIA